MKFLYKIWSGYDGFTPRRIAERLQPRKLLHLGWARYIEAVEAGHEVWVYFWGPGVGTPGVYARGFVHSVDAARKQVLLRVRQFSAARALTDADTARRIAAVVAARGLQVFIYPEAWETPPDCTIDVDAESCRNRMCGACSVWKRLPRIAAEAHRPPPRLPAIVAGFAPGYWVVPARCYLHQEGRSIAAAVERTSQLFYRFKSGEANLAYPLALGMYQALRKRNLLDFDGIVPIPLSPDKAAEEEIHRTRLLAEELGPMLDVPVDDLLSLGEAISKRRLRLWQGLTARQFEQRYRAALRVDPRVRSYQRLLLVDDVATAGSTLRSAAERVHEVHPNVILVAVTAGQMILKQVVTNEAALVAAT